MALSLAIRKHKSKTELVYESLKKFINSGQWKVGERRNANELAKALNVSRTPVIEASKILEIEGLLKVLPQVGLEVSKLTHNEVREVFLIRGVLSGLATAQAYDHLTDKDLGKLENLVELMDECVATGDYEHFPKINREFHWHIYRACKLPNLIMLLERYWNNGNRYSGFFKNLPETRTISAQHHHRILEALKSGDKEEARIAAEKDSMDFGMALSKFVRENSNLID
jgi:DNA-binding GntR family transcriptional regulator